MASIDFIFLFASIIFFLHENVVRQAIPNNDRLKCAHSNVLNYRMAPIRVRIYLFNYYYGILVDF